LIRGPMFCQKSVWSHIKHDRKGNVATIFRHVIVCLYVAIKTEEGEPGKWTNEPLSCLRWFSTKLNNPTARIQAFDPSAGPRNGKKSEEWMLTGNASGRERGRKSSDLSGTDQLLHCVPKR
jgi:hypothetical protein